MARDRSPLSVLATLLVLLALVLVPLPPLAAAAAPKDKVPPGGAPPRGTGDLEIRSFPRVISGDTIEVDIGGKRAGLGLLGIDAPAGNTSCGREAAELLQRLVGRAGGLTLSEDPDATFDDRKRRLYDPFAANDRGLLLSEALVRAGVARATGEGKSARALAAAEAAARNERRGCLWGGATGGMQATVGDVAPLAAQAAPEPVLTIAATTLVAGFTQDRVAGGLNLPTAFALLPDGRALVTEKSGLVRLIKNGALVATPFIDLRGQVNDYWDRGLLGVAADKNFATNGYVYLLYTYENNAAEYEGPKTARLTRVTAVGDTAALASATTILGTTVGRSCLDFAVGTDCISSDEPSHSVGAVKVAADGTLFVTIGDGSSFNVVDPLALRTQNLDLQTGKVLHVTPSGAGVPGNPFWTGSAASNKSKVWAYGVRNAFRFNLRPDSGIPYLGDVGWSSWEEVNAVPAGANLGWPCYEGVGVQVGYESQPTSQAQYARGPGAVQAPVLDYDHNGGGGAVTGGPFYSGTTFPATYQGAYFYGDYTQNYIRYLKVDANNNLVSGPTDLATGADGPVAIELGADGHLYYLSINTGELRRIRYTGGPPPPGGTAYLSDLAYAAVANGWGPAERDRSNGEAAPGDGAALTLGGVAYAKGLGVHAPAEVRYALGGGCTAFAARVGVDDEMGANGAVAFRVFADGALLFDSGAMTGATATGAVAVDVAGRAELRLVVDALGDPTSDHGDWADATLACAGGGTPAATITAPTAALRYNVGDVINYAGTATDASGAAIPASGLAWQITIAHCPGGTCHNHPLRTSAGPTGSFTVPDHGDESRFELALTATDGAGRQGTATVVITPQTVQLTLATVPTGLQVVYGGATHTAPVTLTVDAGGTRSIAAPSPQTLGGTGYTFGSWSDAGAQQHNVTLGTTNSTYTATFTGGTPPPNPVPTLTGLSPAAATAGGAAFTLTATGTGFASGATVRWNGADRATTFVSATQLTATIPASDIAAAGTAQVTVVNPAPGGGASGGRTFTVNPSGGTACAVGQWRAEYFNNKTLGGTPALTRCETAIDYTWGTARPATAINADGFSVRWTGQFDFAAGNYRFTVIGDDGIRLFLDGAQLINGWKNQAATTYTLTRGVTAGRHEVKVEHYDNTGSAVAKASWAAVVAAPPALPVAGDSQARQAVVRRREVAA